MGNAQSESSPLSSTSNNPKNAKKLSETNTSVSESVVVHVSRVSPIRLPKRIILIRHGQSLGNVDESAYCRIPDWKIPLTPNGEEQAKMAGIRIHSIIGDEPISIFCSPYLRTKQTLAAIMTKLRANPIVGAREEPRVTEQQFGNFQEAECMRQYKADRGEFGRFFYRFPQGESGLDVYNRVTLFIGTLFREWEKLHDGRDTKDTNVIIVTHGLTLRLFLMRWFQFSVQEFEQSRNPSNAAVVVMTRCENASSASCATVSSIHEHEHSSHYELDSSALEDMKFSSPLESRRRILEEITISQHERSNSGDGASSIAFAHKSEMDLKIMLAEASGATTATEHEGAARGPADPLDG